MFSSLRRALVGLAVIAASTVAVPVATAVGAPSPSSAQVGPVAQTVVSPMTTPAWSNTNIVAVSSGFKGSCAIQGTGPTSTSGTLFCWGTGPIVGDGSNNSSNVPVAVSATAGFTNTAVTAVAVGEGHACAIEAGMLWCWGSAFLANQWGVLGAGVASSLTPILVSANGDFDNDGAAGDAVTAVAAAYAVTCAIEGGQTFCWGNNNSDNLGVGPNAPSPINEPTRVRDSATPEFQAATATELSVGFFHVCATASTSVYCWGFNNEGRLGDGTNTFSNAPLKAAQGDFATANANVSGLDLGWYHSCALQGGIVRCWGEGADNRLGTGSTTDVSSPINVVSGNGFTNAGNVTAVSAGEQHTCAIESGTLYCWGMNSSGRLGDGTTTNAASPVAVLASDVPGFNNTAVTAVSAGSQHTCAIENKVVYCWGSNTDNQLGDGASMTQLKPVRVFVTSAPAAPTISVRTGASGELNVDVTKPNDGGSAITAYEYRVDGGTPISVAFGGGNFQSISVTGLTDGTQYSFEVRAVNAIGSSAWSTAATGTPTAMQNNPNPNPNPNPNQPPQCVAGSLTVTGSQPVLDSSWGTGGWTTFQAVGGASYYQSRSLVPTSDNNFLLIGSTPGSNFNQAIDVRKFDATGALVNAFGTNGQLVIEDNSAGWYPSGIAVDSTGKIYVLAMGNQGPGSGFLIRLTSTGTLDTSYDTDGILPLSNLVGTSLGSSLAPTASGDVYVVSSSPAQNGPPSQYVSKFSTSGLDTNFGTNGSIDTSSFGGRYVAVLADGSLIVAGNSQGQMKLAKYSSAGVADSSWATSGVATFGNTSVSESARSVIVAGQDLIVSYTVSVFDPNQPGPPSMGAGVAKVAAATGAVDTTFGIDGGVYVPLRSGIADSFQTTVLSDGSIAMGMFVDVGSQNPTGGFLRFSATGQMDAAFATSETFVQHGTCSVNPPAIVDLGNGSVLFAGGKDQPNGSSTEVVVGKFTFGAFTAGTPGGGFTGASPSPSPNNNPSPAPVTPPSTTPPADDDDAPAPRVPGRPNLVTDENRPNLVRTPGQGGAVINGEDRPVQTEVIDSPAAQVRPERRTPAQVNQIRQAANELVQQFTQQLPDGAPSTVQVVPTETGAIIRGLVTDANGNSIDVPAEDVVLMQAEDLVVMVGAQSANVTPDGRFQVPVGSTFGLAGTGFGGEEEGEFVVMSTPTLIAEFETSEVGTFDQTGTLPQSIGVGDHTLVVATGSTYAVLGIQVVPTTLPVTGSSNDVIVVFAMFTVVFGALLVRSRRTLIIV